MWCGRGRTCGRCVGTRGRWWGGGGGGGRVDVVDGVGGVSSSGVRALLRAGKEVEGLVDKNVLAYIKEHGLYADVDADE